MSEQFDVVIVGARAAGAPLAAELARAGVRVCVVDQAKFPSDTASTHVVQPSGVKLLRELGVVDDLLAVAPPLERITMSLDDVTIRADAVSALVGAPGLCVRRITLDQVLVNAAVAAGADVRTRTAVTGLLSDDGDRVCGVRTSHGDIRARVVVGADGVSSTVARLVGASEYAVTAPGRAFTWSYFDAPMAPRDLMWFGKRGEHGFLASPTDNGQFLALVAVPVDARDELRGEREEVLRSGVRRWTELADAIDGAQRVGPVRAVVDWHGFFRTSAGPGWVLAGDAGHFKDPTPGQGITDALRQVRHLAAALQQSLTAGDPDEPLRAWWRWRDADAWQMYWFASDLGAPGATPPVQHEMLRRIAADPLLSMQLFRALDHDLPPGELFTPALLLRAAASRLRHGRGQRRLVVREVSGLLRNTVARERLRRQELPSTGAALPVTESASSDVVETVA